MLDILSSLCHHYHSRHSGSYEKKPPTKNLSQMWKNLVWLGNKCWDRDYEKHLRSEHKWYCIPENILTYPLRNKSDYQQWHMTFRRTIFRFHTIHTTWLVFCSKMAGVQLPSIYRITPHNKEFFYPSCNFQMTCYIFTFIETEGWSLNLDFNSILHLSEYSSF
jgi:hypothetical protein